MASAKVQPEVEEVAELITNGNEASSRELQQKAKEVQNPNIIDPSGTFMKRWDLLMLILLMFTATVTPFEVAFLKPNLGDGLFIINRMVDFGFILVRNSSLAFETLVNPK